MFEPVVTEYLDKTKGKDWSILGILEFARSNSNPKLSVATIDDFKDDLYAMLQSYTEKCNVHVYTRNRATKILSRFNSLFSTAEVKQFIKDLEYHEEARLNVTSTYTATVLKDQQENQKLIDQLRETRNKQEHEKIARLLDVEEDQEDRLHKRQRSSSGQSEVTGNKADNRKDEDHIYEDLETSEDSEEPLNYSLLECDEAESSSGKQTWQEHDFAPESELLQDHDENNSNELSDLCNSQEESVEYDVEAILNESETCSQEMNKILSSFRTYQHETRNILSEDGIMDLSPTSEFVLLYTEEADYDKLIKEIFESIDKMFPEKAHEFLTNFFSENSNEDQWEEKLESLMENKGSPEDFCQQSGENPRQDKFITKLKIFILETLPTFFDAYKLMSENPLKNREMAEDEYMNTFVHPILKKALIRFSGIRYVPGNKAILASAYRKTIMNQDGKADRADGIAYTSNQQNSYEISVVEGSRPYVTERNKETSDFIQNARAAKDMINFAVTQEVLHKRALPSYFRTFMVQVFEFNLRFYFMDYLAQYCIFEIETCEIPTDWKETLQFTSFYRAIVTWALLVGEADKKFQQFRNKRSSRLSNCHNIRKVLKLSHNKARGGKKRDMTMTKLI